MLLVLLFTQSFVIRFFLHAPNCCRKGVILVDFMTRHVSVFAPVTEQAGNTAETTQIRCHHLAATLKPKCMCVCARGCVCARRVLMP